MLFICYPKCSTCKKAKEWLDSHDIKYETRHIVENRPEYEELKVWTKTSGMPINKFFNTSGLVYKEKNLKEKLKTASDEEKLHLLAENGMLVKRPLLVSEEMVLVGFNEDKWSVLLK